MGDVSKMNYPINSSFKSIGEGKMRTQELGKSVVTPTTEFDAESKDFSEGLPVTGRTESFGEVLSEDVSDLGPQKGTLDGSQQVTGEYNPHTEEIQSFDTLNSVSTEKELGMPKERGKSSISRKNSLSKLEKHGAEIKKRCNETTASASEKEIGLSKKNEIRVRRDGSSASFSTSTGDKGPSKTAKNLDESVTSSSFQSCKRGDAETSSRGLDKDKSCQVNCSLDDSKVNELRMLKEKLAISKKDTETMRKLLEDVRKDYEDLQKSFEKRDEEMKLERAELSRKSSKMEGSFSSTSEERSRPRSSEVRPKSSEKRNRGLDKVSVTSRENLTDSGDLACPCFTQNIRKIITDVTDDFKEVISAIKQSSAEERERMGNEFAMLKSEYTCALEKKDSESRALEETVKGLQARIREAEREADECRKTTTLAFEEKEKLHYDVCALNKKLVKVQHERDASQADLERIKYGLKRYCTAEEYEELQRMDFKFSDVSEVEGTSSLQRNSESDKDFKMDKFYPVLKKAKKEIKKLKKEKGDLESLLKERMLQSTEKEKYLNKKISKTLNSLKESEVKICELKDSLETLTAENSKFIAKINELEGQRDTMQRQHIFEMKIGKDKLNISEESAVLQQAKYAELQREHERLRHGYNDLKKFLDYTMANKEDGLFNDDPFHSEDTVGYALKIDSSSPREQLKAERTDGEDLYKEINILNGDAWKRKAGSEDVSVQHLQVENEDLKEEIRDNRAFIKQLMTKKKGHAQIIHKMFTENRSLKTQLNKALEVHRDHLLDSDDKISGVEPGIDGTTTQEHRQRIDKDRKMTKLKQPSDFSSDEEDSFYLHHLDDVNDMSLSNVSSFVLFVLERVVATGAILDCLCFKDATDFFEFKLAADSSCFQVLALVSSNESLKGRIGIAVCPAPNNDSLIPLLSKLLKA